MPTGLLKLVHLSELLFDCDFVTFPPKEVSTQGFNEVINFLRGGSSSSTTQHVLIFPFFVVNCDGADLLSAADAALELKPSSRIPMNQSEADGEDTLSSVSHVLHLGLIAPGFFSNAPCHCPSLGCLRYFC